VISSRGTKNLTDRHGVSRNPPELQHIAKFSRVRTSPFRRERSPQRDGSLIMVKISV
jgi:hypothetical protein